MKTMRIFLIGVVLVGICVKGWAGDRPLRVVTTLPDYAVIAKAIGDDRVEVQAIVKGEQDAHFIRPKPSFVDMVRQADVLIDTGLDLEMWLPTVIDKAGNKRVRSGQEGYVAASKGMHMLEKPQVMSRAEGGLHVYGNPHVTCSPVNIRVAARNIAAGLIKNDPAGKAQYEKGLKEFIRKIDEKLFGLEEAGTVEPKPGIPPSPRHVLELTRMMKDRKIKIILAANYFDEHKIGAVADKVGAEPVIVPLYVGGQEGIDDYFELVDLWVNALLEAAKNKKLL